MLLCLQNVCPPETVAELRRLAAESEYADGRKTAGWAAREVKRNEQVEAGPRIDTVRRLVRTALMDNPLFVSFAQPKSVTRMLVSRYTPGMEYGLHVDDALMGGRRADLSFTLFLSEPDSYAGGELVMEGIDGETEIKLAPGEAVVYPTAALHRVAPVTEGERLAVVGWVRSLVRRARPAGNPVRSRPRLPRPVRARGQDARARPPAQEQGQPAAPVGGGLGGCVSLVALDHVGPVGIPLGLRLHEGAEGDDGEAVFARLFDNVAGEGRAHPLAAQALGHADMVDDDPRRADPAVGRFAGFGLASDMGDIAALVAGLFVTEFDIHGRAPALQPSRGPPAAIPAGTSAERTVRLVDGSSTDFANRLRVSPSMAMESISPVQRIAASLLSSSDVGRRGLCD